MTTPDPTPGKPKISRAGGAKRGGFDLTNPTAPSNDAAAPTPEAPPAPAEPATGNAVAQLPTPAPQAPNYLSRSDIRGGGAPPAGGGGGLVVSLGSLVTQVDPETDLVQFNMQLPRYYVAAVELMIATQYGTTTRKREIARQAFQTLIPEAFLAEAHRALYPHLHPQQ